MPNTRPAATSNLTIMPMPCPVLQLPPRLGFTHRVKISFRTPALSLRRVGADEFLVDVGAPAGAGRQQKIAVLDDRRPSDDVVLPPDIVDVDLHDLEIRHHGREMRADQ